MPRYRRLNGNFLEEGGSYSLTPFICFLRLKNKFSRPPDAPYDEHHPSTSTVQPCLQQPSVPRSVTSPPSLCW